MQSKILVFIAALGSGKASHLFSRFRSIGTIASVHDSSNFKNHCSPSLNGSGYDEAANKSASYSIFYKEELIASNNTVESEINNEERATITSDEGIELLVPQNIVNNSTISDSNISHISTNLVPVSSIRDDLENATEDDQFYQNIVPTHFVDKINDSIPEPVNIYPPLPSDDGVNSIETLKLHNFEDNLEAEIANKLEIKYKGRFLSCKSSVYPNCNIYLCGTLHVAKTSADMVQEVIQCIHPNYVVLELCEGRIDNLLEVDEPANLTLAQVIRGTFEDRSIKTFGMGLLAWMQLKAANIMGNKLGGELITAAKEAHKVGAMIVLGDRLYSVTIQRIFDRLGLWEKVKMVFVVIWEVVTMSLFKIKDYIRKTEDDVDFIKGEIDKFSKHMPSFADVIIAERDEYLSQTLHEIADVGFGGRYLGKQPREGNGVLSRDRKNSIVAVIGAGHLLGVQKHLSQGVVSIERIHEISRSSKHVSPTWPGRGILHVVNSDVLFAQKVNASSS